MKLYTVVLVIFVVAGCKQRIQNSSSGVKFVKLDSSDMYLDLVSDCLHSTKNTVKLAPKDEADNRKELETVNAVSKVWYSSYKPPKEFYKKFASIQPKRENANYVVRITSCSIQFFDPPFKDGDAVTEGQLRRAENHPCKATISLAVFDKNGTVVDVVEDRTSKDVRGIAVYSDANLGRLKRSNFSDDYSYIVNQLVSDCRTDVNALEALMHDAITAALKRITVK